MYIFYQSIINIVNATYHSFYLYITFGGDWKKNLRILWIELSEMPLYSMGNIVRRFLVYYLVFKMCKKSSYIHLTAKNAQKYYWKKNDHTFCREIIIILLACIFLFILSKTSSAKCVKEDNWPWKFLRDIQPKWHASNFNLIVLLYDTYYAMYIEIYFFVKSQRS